jgi:hypothetical protein
MLKRRDRPNFWLLIVVMLPLGLLDLLEGWGKGWSAGTSAMFRSGAAPLFICGVIVAALGENVVEQAEADPSPWLGVFTNARSWLWWDRDNRQPSKAEKMIADYRLAAFGAVVLFALNLWLGLKTRTANPPQVGWLIAVVVLGAFVAQVARFPTYIDENTGVL